MLNLTVEKTTIWLLLPLLFCARDTATYPRQQQQQQWQQQEPLDQQRLLSVNEKQVQTIVNNMNTSADPCNDIFTYACGSWPSYHITPRYTEVTGLLEHKMNKKFALLLEDLTSRNESQRSELDEAIFQKLRTYYKSCRRQKSLQIRHFLQLVRPAGHVNWPMLDGSATWPDGKRITLWITLAKLRRYGLKGALISHFVIPKMDKSNEYAIFLDRAAADKLLPSMFEMLAVFLALGLSTEKAFLQYLKIHDLEQEIHKLLQAEDDSQIHEIAVWELRAQLPQVPWRRYLEVVLDGTDIGENFTLQISNLEYFVQLAQLLERTDPVVTFNYLMVMFLAHLKVESASAFEKIQCVMEVRSKMDMAANYIYRKRLYGAEAAVYQNETSALLERLRLQMEKLIDQNRLAFEPAEVAALKQKLNAVHLNLGNLPLGKQVESGSQDQLLAEFIDDYYKDLSLSPRNYYKNQLALLELRFRKEHQQVLRPPTSSNYLFVADSDSARSSSPYFIMNQNVIFVPFGNFLTPMFHRNMHDLLKISLFGFVLAHELAHGFDVSGILIDHQGNAHDLGKNMSESTNFSQGVECLQRNGTESIDERVADVVGVRLAYEAYFGQPNVDVSARLPFTDFSARRLFFLNMAQFFCGIRSTIFLDHDSDGVRLQQTLSNFEPFAEEFGCRVGDAMHPAEKCRLY